MIVDITNPHDSVTIEAETPADAGAALVLLGAGAYGGTGEDGEEIVPIMLFASKDSINRWFKTACGQTVADHIRSHLAQIAAVLRSVVYGGPGNRRTVVEAMGHMEPDQAAEFLRRHNDRHRSSLTNLEAKGNVWADKLDKMDEEGKEIPDDGEARTASAV